MNVVLIVSKGIYFHLVASVTALRTIMPKMNGAYGCKLTEHIELHAPQTQGVAGNRTWNIYMTAGTTMHRITSGMITSLFTQQNVNNLTSSNTTTYSYYFINSPYTFAIKCVPSGKKCVPLYLDPILLKQD